MMFVNFPDRGFKSLRDGRPPLGQKNKMIAYVEMCSVAETHFLEVSETLCVSSTLTRGSRVFVERKETDFKD